jgi:hypothetical protein
MSADYFWAKLLQNKPSTLYGLTFPYLLGATRLFYPETKREDIRVEMLNLLNLMGMKNPYGRSVGISFCNTLRQPVATLFRSYYGPPLGYKRISPDIQGDFGLYAQMLFFKDDLANVNMLVEHLVSCHGEDIVKERFSFLNGKFDNFSKADIETISWILEKEDEEY